MRVTRVLSEISKGKEWGRVFYSVDVEITAGTEQVRYSKSEGKVRDLKAWIKTIPFDVHGATRENGIFLISPYSNLL